MEQLERQGVPDPLIWFTYVAAKTRTIKFLSGVMLLTERNPLHTAKEAATLAVLSEGRLMLGVGSGWCREEYEALGVSWPNRGKRLDEYIEVCRTLWREPVASYKGEFVNFERLYSDPKPPAGFVPIISADARRPRRGAAADLATAIFRRFSRHPTCRCCFPSWWRGCAKGPGKLAAIPTPSN